MAIKWGGPLAAYMPEASTLVMLGTLDSKKQFRIIGAVFPQSQQELVKDLIEEGSIAFQDGTEYGLTP